MGLVEIEKFLFRLKVISIRLKVIRETHLLEQSLETDSTGFLLSIFAPIGGFLFSRGFGQSKGKVYTKGDGVGNCKRGSYYDNLTIGIVDLDKLYQPVSKSRTRVTTRKNCWRKK